MVFLRRRTQRMCSIDLSCLTLDTFPRRLSACTASVTSTTMPVIVTVANTPFDFTPYPIGHNPSKVTVKVALDDLDVEVSIKKRGKVNDNKSPK